MAALVKALERHQAAAGQLRLALPPDATVHGLDGEIALALALRFHGLAPWVGRGLDATGGQPMAATLAGGDGRPGCRPPARGSAVAAGRLNDGSE